MFSNSFVCRCIDYLSDLHEQFQVESSYDVNVEYQIWSFCYNFFFNYVDSRKTDTHIEKKISAIAMYNLDCGSRKNSSMSSL